jgi:serine/threonine protein phosphatase PrpC
MVNSIEKTFSNNSSLQKNTLLLSTISNLTTTKKKIMSRTIKFSNFSSNPKHRPYVRTQSRTNEWYMNEVFRFRQHNGNDNKVQFSNFKTKWDILTMLQYISQQLINQMRFPMMIPIIAQNTMITNDSSKNQSDMNQTKIIHTIKSGAASLTGRRPSNEDYHFCQTFDDASVQGVNDGHAGSSTAKHLNDHLIQLSDETKGNFSKINLTKKIPEINAKIKESKVDNGSGSCMIMLNVKKTTEGLIATAVNLGDSRAIIGVLGGNYERLGRDHHPSDLTEKVIIEERGGFVGWGKRLNGTLAVSRACGDFSFDGVVNDEPEVHYAGPFNKDATVIGITACDGFFERFCFTDQSLWEFVNKKISENPSRDLHEIALEAANEAYNLGSYDNLSIVITKHTPKSA